jgi:hypothetical protein
MRTKASSLLQRAWAGAPAARGRASPSLGVMLAGSMAAGLLLSTQFLVQGFVWRHFELDEVLAGWLEVARDQVLVAVTLACTFVLVRWLLWRRGWGPAALACSIVTGALLGQEALVLVGSAAAPQSLVEAAAPALRWIAVGLSVAGIVHFWRQAVQRRVDLQNAELRMLQSKRQLAELSLQRLRAQIEPHFLYNTLATARLLGDRDAALGAGLLRDFAAYLRQLVEAPLEQETTLGRELDLVEAYLRLIAVRMGPRLALQLDVPAALRGCAFPVLALATLVENAIKHGLAPLPAGGTLHIVARCSGAVLEVDVRDTGAGLRADAGAGIGLANTRERLTFLYGANAALQLRQFSPHGVCATLRMPLRALAP